MLGNFKRSTKVVTCNTKLTQLVTISTKKTKGKFALEQICFAGPVVVTVCKCHSHNRSLAGVSTRQDKAHPSPPCYSSAGLSWVRLMLQHQAHSRNRPTATDEKKKSLLYFGCNFSRWYNFQKIIKIVATNILQPKCTPQTLQLDLRGPTSKWKEGKKRA